MQSTLNRLDPLIARMLFIRQMPTPLVEQEDSEKAQQAFSFALLFSGVRCILMYVVLPFILPLIGLAGNFSIWIDIAINVVAICAIFYSLRRFWQTGYERRWQYLPVALVALFVLVAFIGLDIATLI
jgi:uncharacterized membrane protein